MKAKFYINLTTEPIVESAALLSLNSAEDANTLIGTIAFGKVFKGEKGDKGDNGEQGIQGERGMQGEKGDTGERGVQGIQGEKGDKGDQGEQGVQGEKGENGADGYTPQKGVDYFTEVYVMKNTESWIDVFAKSSNIELIKGEVYLADNIEIPSGTIINGNNAIITPSSKNTACFLFTFNNNDIRINGVHFKGDDILANNTVGVGTHCAIKSTRSYRNTITNCTFENFHGSAIVVTGNASDFGGVFTHATIISDNRFRNNFCSCIVADRSEYSKICDNMIYGGAYGVIANSGNWQVSNNIIVACTAPYVSVAQTITIGGTQMTFLTSDNWNHGAFIGNTLNHCNSGNTWKNNRTITLGIDGNVSLNGVYIKGLLAPTFSANTMYYCDITVNTNLPEWVISGCIHSNGVITNDNTSTKVYVVGTGYNASSTVAGNNIQYIKYKDYLSVGDLSNLLTTNKDSVVNAINELKLATPNNSVGTEVLTPGVLHLGYNANLRSGDPLLQGFVKIGTNPYITDPMVSGFADVIPIVDTKSGGFVLLAKDNSSTHNPQLYRTIVGSEFKSLYDNGGTFNIKCKPFIQPSTSTTIRYNGLILLGVDSAVNPGWNGGANGGYMVNIGFSTGDSATKTCEAHVRINNTNVYSVGRVNVDDYLDINIVSMPGDIPANLHANGVLIGQVPYTNYSGASFSNRVCWASGSTGGVIDGLLIKSMQFTINTDDGRLILSNSNNNFIGVIRSDFNRDYSITIPDNSYNSGTLLDIKLDIPNGRTLTLKPSSDAVLINGKNKDIILTSSGVLNTFSFMQEISPKGNIWVEITENKEAVIWR